MGFATDAIHAGQEPEPVTGAVMPPIFQTSTYVHLELGKDRGYDYGRTINPTRSALERSLAALEGGERAFCFASGMSAIHAVTALLKAGDHVVVSDNVYGGVFRLFKHVLEDYDLHFSWVDTSDLDAVAAALRPATRMLYVETPTNPMMTITDVAAAAELCREREVVLVVDNTFLSPVLQRPFELGADIVLHSTTKYINGHSDAVGGVVVTRRQEHGERIHFVQRSAGAVLAPFEAWLTLRGVKTLPLRMERHDATGRAVAAHLRDHAAVERVFYPGLEDHPQHALARRQMRGFGGMIGFELGTYARAKTFLDAVRVCALAESLGGVETLVCHPATMTHASVPPEERARIGISEGLVRISVGIEDAEDLIADIDQALGKL